MIEIRSAEGRLLCKVADDWSAIEIVQRRHRYTVQRVGLQALIVSHSVIVSIVEEVTEVNSDNLPEFEHKK